MPITETDLVFLEAERMDDSPQGGGRMIGNVIQDGKENNIFRDVGPGARVSGRVFLREVFAANRSNDADPYLDAHIALIERPEDPAIDVTLFMAGNGATERDSAKDYLERYLARGGYFPGTLYGNHIAGQRVIQIFSLVGMETVNIGQTLVLIQDESTTNEIEQYIRITRAETVTREFVDSVGSYFRQVTTAEISDPLRSDFIGQEPTRTTNLGGRTRLRDTVAAAATRVASARPLALPVLAGERQMTVDSIYTQIVPAAQSETPLIDLDAANAITPLVPSSGSTVSVTTSAALSPTASLYLGLGIEPSSLQIQSSGIALTENGRGQLINGATVEGGVDYAQGNVSGLSGGPSYLGAKTATWKPVGAPLTAMHSAALAVTAESRALNYVITLLPIPRPGTLRVDYQVAGKWYRLQDRGDGALVGASSSHGAGSASFTTGTALVTLGALPDIASAILFFWSNAPDAKSRGGSAFDPPAFLATLAQKNVLASTLALNWTVDTVAKTATVSAAGVISGDASGTLSASTGDLKLIPAVLPPPGTEISASYQYGPPKEVVFTAPLREPNGHLILQLPDTNIVPHSLELVWNLDIENYDAISTTPAEMQIRPRIDPYKTVRDDGNGAIVISGGTNGVATYATGRVELNPDVTVSIPWARYSVTQLGVTADGKPIYRNTFTGFDYKPAGALFPSNESGKITVRYRVAGGEGSVSGEILTVAALTLDATKDYAETIVAGSLQFALGGRVYLDRAGVLYYGIDSATGSGTPGGSLDLGNGQITVTDWASGVAPTQSLHALLTQLAAPITDETVFRIAISPVRPGSVSVRATPVLPGGTAINLTAGIDGKIYAAGIADGKIDYQNGVGRIRWGGWLNDADVTAAQKLEPWYDVNARVEIGGVLKIFKPRPVYADTIRYNAVGYSYLPLSADLIGLDPVRLPSDGRVPCLNKGDTALITHHTTQTVVTPVAGGTVSTGLTKLARVRVYDANNTAVPPNRYSAAKDTGIVTWATPLDLADYTGPYRVEGWIEDAAMIIDTDISGLITLNMPLAHDYPAGALCSSALVHGDLYAQPGAMFAQQAWSGVWSDERIGNPILSQYNNLLHPPILTNAASWRERWALLFTSTTSFRVIGETLGDITNNLGGAGYHDISHDLAPINPLTGTPYFVLKWQGWGSGWVAGNVLRLDFLKPANFPFWVAMTVKPSQPTEGQDRFRLLLRGGVDA